MILLKKKVWVLFSEETRHDLTWLQINFKHTNFLHKQIHVLVNMAETLFISQPIDHRASQYQPRFLRILNSFCEIFEKRTPHGSMNSLQNGLVVPSNHLRISLLAFRVICVSFLGVNKDFSE